MKGFQKLALVAAIAAAPFAAQAEMTAMDDSLLSEMTGQAGVTLDLNLDMSIAEIRYSDEDGSGTDIGDGGYLTLSTIVVNGDQGNGTQAEIKGVTIDVDGSDGIVIGLGQIGGVSSDVTAAGTDDALLGAEVVASNYWTGVNISADLGINGVAAGSIAIKNFTNYVPNALAVEAVNKFGYDIVDTSGAVTGTAGTTLNFANAYATEFASSGDAALAAAAGAAAQGNKVILSNNTDANVASIAGLTTAVTAEYTATYAALSGAGATDEQIWDLAKQSVVTGTDAAGSTGFAAALTAGNYIDASISISAGGSVDSNGGGAEGLTINAVAGFVIEEMTYSDDGNHMGLHNFVMFDTDTDGTITGFKVTGLTIDVVSSGGVDGWAPTNSSATAALKIAGLVTDGTIAMGDIFIGDHDTGSLGAVSIRDINMSNTEIYVYGH